MPGIADLGAVQGTLRLTDQWSAVLNTASGSIGKFDKEAKQAFAAVSLAGAAVTATIAAIGAATVTLGSHGADINDVSATLETFAGSAENAAAILDKMRAGTLGTVDNFELMRASAKLLQADVKLTADQFGTLSEAAFLLQNRGLGTTTEMLDTVSQALLTGRTRALSMSLGIIDTDNALVSYAAALGTTEQALTKTQKAEATRLAVMDLLTKATAEAGQQTRDFGEQLDAMVTAVKNFFDDLSSEVAKSTIINDALKQIGDEVVKAFGGDREAAIRTIVKGLETFATAVKNVTPMVIELAKDLATIAKFMADHPALLEAAGYAVVAYGAKWTAVKLGTIASSLLGLGKAATTTAAALEGGGAAAAATGVAVAATAPLWATVGAGIAVTGAAVAIGYQKWQLYREEQERNAAAARETITNQSNIAIATQMAGHGFASLAEAVQYMNTHYRDLETGEIRYRQTALQTAALQEAGAKRAAAIADEQVQQSLRQRGITLELIASQRQQGDSIDDLAQRYGVSALALQKYIDGLKAAQKDADAEATKMAQRKQAILGGIDDAVKQQAALADVLTTEADRLKSTAQGRQVYLDGLEKQIAAGKRLSDQQLADVQTMQNVTRAITEQGQETLATTKLRLSDIEALQRLGLSEQEIADRYGVTTAALARYEGQLKALTKLQDDYTQMQLATATSTDAALAKNRKSYEDELKLIDQRTALGQEAAAQLLKNRQLADQQAQVDLEALKNNNRSREQEYIRQLNTLQAMLSSAANYSRADIERQREAVQKAEDAWRNYGEATKTAATASEKLRPALDGVTAGLLDNIQTVTLANGQLVKMSDIMKGFVTGFFDAQGREITSTTNQLIGRVQPISGAGVTDANAAAINAEIQRLTRSIAEFDPTPHTTVIVDGLSAAKAAAETAAAQQHADDIAQLEYLRKMVELYTQNVQRTTAATHTATTSTTAATAAATTGGVAGGVRAVGETTGPRPGWTEADMQEYNRLLGVLNRTPSGQQQPVIDALNRLPPALLKATFEADVRHEAVAKPTSTTNFAPGSVVLNYPIVNDKHALDQLGRVIDQALINRARNIGTA